MEKNGSVDMNDFFFLQKYSYNYFNASAELMEKRIAGLLPPEEIIDFRKLFRGDMQGCKLPMVYREYKEYSGKKFGDLMGSECMDELISDRMRDLLLENGITGWTFYPIELFDKKVKQIFGYNGFCVTGKCGGKMKRKYGKKNDSE